MTSVIDAVRILGRGAADGAVRGVVSRELPQVARIVVAAAVAWQISIWLGASHPPVYAVVVPLVAMRDEPYSALNVSGARLIGVVAGLCVGIGVLHVLRPSTLAVSLVLSLSLLVGMTVRVGGSLNVQVAASGMLVFANADPGAYAVRRLGETAVGVVVTLLLAPLLFPPNPRMTVSRQLETVVTRLGAEMASAAALAGTADVSSLAALLTDVRATDAQARALPVDLVAAQRSARLNPLWRRRELPRLQAMAPLLQAAPGVAAWVLLLVDDLLDVGRRADLTAHWVRRREWMPTVGASLGEAISSVLLGADGTAPLSQARAALDKEGRAERTPIGGVARRPLIRLVAELEALNRITALRRGPAT